jgi:hypothetical protein
MEIKIVSPAGYGTPIPALFSRHWTRCFVSADCAEALIVKSSPLLRINLLPKPHHGVWYRHHMCNTVGRTRKASHDAHSSGFRRWHIRTSGRNPHNHRSGHHRAAAGFEWDPLSGRWGCYSARFKHNLLTVDIVYPEIRKSMPVAGFSWSEPGRKGRLCAG